MAVWRAHSGQRRFAAQLNVGPPRSSELVPWVSEHSPDVAFFFQLLRREASRQPERRAAGGGRSALREVPSAEREQPRRTSEPAGD